MSVWRFLFPKKPDLEKARGLRSELACSLSRHKIATQNSEIATDALRKRMSDILDGIKTGAQEIVK